MKIYIISTVLLLSLTLGVQAQSSVENENHVKTLEQIDSRTYKVTYKDDAGIIVQKGQLWKQGKKLIPHGTWTLFSSTGKEVLTRTEFDKGEQIWIETKIDGKMVRYSQKQLAIKRIENEIKKLETRLASYKNEDS